MTHPSLDTFGDPDRAAADPHVRGCAQCQADLAVQREVRELLSTLPDPGPVPPDVVDRIEATLAALARSPEDAVLTTPDGATETTERGGSPTPGAAGPGAPGSAGSTVVPISQAPSARRRRPLLAAAAAAAVLLGGGYVVSQLVPSSTSSDSASGSAIQDRTSSAPKTAELAQVPVTASGTNYTRSGLEEQLSTRLGGQGAAGLGADDQSESGADRGLLADPKGLAGCLSALGAPGAVPQLVDVARFEGKPAAVIVLPSDDGGREVWVVSTSCRPGQDGMKYFRAIR